MNFEFWINGELSKSAKIWLSKSIFYVNFIRIFLNLYFIEEYQMMPYFTKLAINPKLKIQ